MRLQELPCRIIHSSLQLRDAFSLPIDDGQFLLGNLAGSRQVLRLSSECGQLSLDILLGGEESGSVEGEPIEEGLQGSVNGPFQAMLSFFPLSFCGDLPGLF